MLAVVAGSHALAQPPEQPRSAPEDPEPLLLHGRVYDARTGQPLRGARFTIDGVAIGKTDRDGSFIIRVAPNATVLLEKDGYQITLIDLATSGEVNQVMFPVDETGEVIEVGGEAPTTIGAARLQREDLGRLPGTGGDLLKSLDVLPGVTATTGFAATSGVVIRGSAPEDSKILIDGFEVPLLYHTLAQRSIMPTAAIAGIEYLPGGFDVAFGRASSGVVAVTTRTGGDKAGGEAEIAVIDAGLVAQTPLGKKSHALVAFRRSVVDLLFPLVIPDDANIRLTTVPHFYDAQLRLDTKFSTRWRGSVSAIAATDTLELFADDEEDPDARFYQDSRFVRLIASAAYYAKPWSATIAASGLGQKYELLFGRDQGLALYKSSATVRAEVTRTAAAALGLCNVEARVGAEIEATRNRLNLAVPQSPDEGQPSAMTIGDEDTAVTFDGVIWTPDVASWAATSADLDPRVRLTAGLRVDAFTRNHEVAVQPRGELAIKVNDRTKVRLTSGAYRRPAYNRQELLDATLKSEHATQNVIGIERTSNAGLKLQTSLYYTDRTQLLTQQTDGSYANQGRGTTYGAELLATYKRGPWFGWLSYSYSHSTRRDQPGAATRLFDYDQPHDLNLLLSWKGKKWQVGGRLQYASGNPYTPVIGSTFDSDRDRFDPIYATVNSDRLPSHYQVDVRIDRALRLGGVKLSAFLDVQNVTYNASVSGIGYNYDYSERYDFEGLPILPSIGLRGEL